MEIEIREIHTRKQRKQFIDFVNDLYKLNPYYCPPFYADTIKSFNPKHNPSFEVCEEISYMAFINSQPVGRITGIINYAANKTWDNKRVRFGYFDFIDDISVSHALLAKVEAWGKSKGMTELNGPIGFTDFDPQGLLVEGFDHVAPVVSLYNYPYYAQHIERYGLSKEMDWLEYQLAPPKEVPAKMLRVGNIIKEKYKLNIVKVKSAKELKKRYGFSYIDLVDLAYQPLYNFQPLTRAQKIKFCETQFPFLNFDFLTLVTNQKDEIIGLGAGLPDISDALRACGGKLFPFGWYKIMRALKAKKIEAFDLLLIAVHPDYQNKGVNALFAIDQIPYFKQYEIQRIETTSILEVNTPSISTFSDFDKKQHKRRRAYLKMIG